MESLGNYLRHLRLARGLSLGEVARATRVVPSYLEALEADRLSQLPAPVFTKGFIRAYCQALGELPAEAIARYTTALRQLDPPALAPSEAPATRGRSPGPALVSLILLIALGLGLFLVSRVLQERSAPAVTARTVSAPSGLSQPATSLLRATPMIPQSEGAAQVRLVARTTEPTWVRVQLDRGKVIEELIPAGAMRQWTSDQRFALIIGNAGGISLELNGRSLPPLGASGAVIRLVLPPDARATDP